MQKGKITEILQAFNPFKSEGSGKVTAEASLSLTPSKEAALYTYDSLALALQKGDLKALQGIYKEICSFDTQVSSELNSRIQNILKNPMVVSSENKEVQAYLEALCESLRPFLYAALSSIGLGARAFILNYHLKTINGREYLMPTFKLLEPLELKDGKLMCKGKDLRELAKKYKERIFIYEHYNDPLACALASCSLLATLKRLAISKNMAYFNSLATPPLIVQSEAINDLDSATALLDQAINLKSDGVGLFGKDDVLKLLDGNVSSDVFLSFIKYADESIAKSINSQVLAGNAVSHGTQALGAVHASLRDSLNDFDSYIYEGKIRALFDTLLTLNFGELPKYILKIDTNKEKDELALATTYKTLSDAGYIIPCEVIEEAFRIKGIEFRGGGIEENASAYKLGLNEVSQGVNTSLPANLNKPITKSEARLQKMEDAGELKGDSGVKEHILGLLDKCDSYEELLELVQNDTTFPLDEMEAELERLVGMVDEKGGIYV